MIPATQNRWLVVAGTLVPSKMHLYHAGHLKGKLNERIDCKAGSRAHVDELKFLRRGGEGEVGFSFQN